MGCFQANQESEESGDDVVARLNPSTGEIENVGVIFFSTQLLRGDPFQLLAVQPWPDQPKNAKPRPVGGSPISRIKRAATREGPDGVRPKSERPRPSPEPIADRESPVPNSITDTMLLSVDWSSLLQFGLYRCGEAVFILWRTTVELSTTSSP